jgi:hypothetical protein
VEICGFEVMSRFEFSEQGWKKKQRRSHLCGLYLCITHNCLTDESHPLKFPDIVSQLLAVKKIKACSY